MTKNPVRKRQCWSRGGRPGKGEAHPSVCWARGRLGGRFHFLELLASWQMPKLVLVMKPMIDLSASQVRPRSHGHL